VEQVLRANRNKRLGLLGMRERVQMVGGNVAIDSTPGEGTTILARIPLADGRALRAQNLINEK
jgi:signal transduction histidine kinase